MGAKLFGTDGVRGKANIYPMTAEFALRLATAAGQLVCNKERRVAIGRDTRLSGEMLEAAMIAGFTSAGADSGGNDVDAGFESRHVGNDYRFAQSVA